jgi:hypothetical protein
MGIVQVNGGYLTLKQAALLLGMPTNRAAMRRFSRLLRAKEASSGTKILVSLESGHFRVTESALREHCPELFSKRDMVLRAIEESRRETDEAIDELRVRVTRVERAMGQK